MTIVKSSDIVYDDFYPELPTNEEIEQSAFDAEGWIPKLSEDQRVVLSFDDIQKWYETWDQSNEMDKYENVYDYIRDCVGNGFHAVISTDSMEYITELIGNITDGDPLADITEKDAQDFICKAKSEYGYSIPSILTPALFVEIYNELKPEE